MRSSPTGLPAAIRASIAALVLTLAWLAASLATPRGATGLASTPVASGLSRWTGGMDLYRPGVFTTQKTLLWCTAADLQIIRNIVDRQADHTRASQARYFSWMRDQNRYPIPVSDGIDPAGWTAGLRHFVDDRYRLVESRSFTAALGAAVTSLRRTNLPVGLLVANGGHAWVLTGFTATADPAVTSSFTVTSVRVVGPLYGIQSRNGYDMRPDTRLTPAQLRRFWTPWHYARIRMAWEGRILAIEARASAAMSQTVTRATAAQSALRATPGQSEAPAGPPRAMPAGPASPRQEAGVDPALLRLAALALMLLALVPGPGAHGPAERLGRWLRAIGAGASSRGRTATSRRR